MFQQDFALKPLWGEKDYKTGSIALRVRRATDHDIEFMEKFNEKSKSNIINFPNITTPTTTIKSILTNYTKKGEKSWSWCLHYSRLN